MKKSINFNCRTQEQLNESYTLLKKKFKNVVIIKTKSFGPFFKGYIDVA